jgi:hypothetical protein
MSTVTASSSALTTTTATTTVTKATASASSSSRSNAATSGAGAAGGGGGGASFNEENFLRKLEKVTPTQESIQSFALWIIHHKNAHEIICKLWLKKLNECKAI